MPADNRDAPAPPAAVAVCSGVVRQIADDLDFDQGLLATRADIAQLLCGEPSRLDEGWRRDIVGDPLRRLISGEVAAAFEGRATSSSRSARTGLLRPRRPERARAPHGLVDARLPPGPVGLAQLVLLELAGRRSVERLAELDAGRRLEVRQPVPAVRDQLGLVDLVALGAPRRAP